MASIGVSGCLAVALVRAVTLAARPGAVRWPARAALVLLLMLHFGLAPLGRLGLSMAFFGLSTAEQAHVEAVDLGSCEGKRGLYVLTGSDPANSMYLGSGLLFHRRDVYERVSLIRTMSMTAADQQMTRVDAASFDLAVVDERPENALERVHRAAPLREGDVVEVSELTVTVTDSTPNGWRAARFTVDGDLDDFCFGRWDGETLVVTEAPAVGERVELPYHPGTMGM